MTCIACRKAKKACDGNELNPCPRCQKSGQPCIPVTPKKRKSTKTPKRSTLTPSAPSPTPSSLSFPSSNMFSPQQYMQQLQQSLYQQQFSSLYFQQQQQLQLLQQQQLQFQQIPASTRKRTRSDYDADERHYSDEEEEDEQYRQHQYYYDHYGAQQHQMQMVEVPRLSQIDHLYLVPIRIDLDDDGNRVIDLFNWNILQTDNTVQSFSEWYCKDMKLPVTMIPIVSRSISTQLTKYYALFCNTHFCNLFFDPKNDLNVIIKLDVRLQETVLKDQFEWNILSNVQPEYFAQRMCEDIGLQSEFIPLIANSISEQIFGFIFTKYERYLQLVNRARQQYVKENGDQDNIDESELMIDFEEIIPKLPVPATDSKDNRDIESAAVNEDQKETREDETIEQKIQEGNDHIIRDEDDLFEWQPRIETLDEDELERIAAKEERESRYRRRRDIYSGGRLGV
jgi:hypothetical protein